MAGFCPQPQNQEEDALLLDLFSKTPFLENFSTPVIPWGQTLIVKEEGSLVKTGLQNWG